MGYDVESNFKDYTEVSTYTVDTVTLKDTLKSIIDEIKKETPTAQFDAAESIMKVSDYNKIARVFGNEEISLKEGEYAVVCNYDMMTGYRNKALKMGTEITINGKTYKPSVSECYDGFIEDSIQAINLGIIIVPDSTKFTREQMEINYFNANYNLGDEKQKADFENKLTKDIDVYSIKIDTSTKIYNYESSKGLGATVTFIGIYLGIIFLITSAAILALKELSESADNIERYKILRKIGTSEKMINKALFMQIGIFFILPLLLAVIHSIFGLKFSDYILSTIGHMNILPSIIITAITIILIYGGYFLITYFSSKKIIKEK